MFTLAAGLAVLAFPPFFVELVAIYSLGGIGYLWRVLDEKGRARLKDFDKDVRIPYSHEKAGKTLEALLSYKKLGQDYQDTPQLLPIILGRIEELEKRLVQAEKASDKKKSGARRKK